MKAASNLVRLWKDKTNFAWKILLNKQDDTHFSAMHAMPGPRSVNITLPNKLKIVVLFFRRDVTTFKAKDGKRTTNPQKNSTWALMIISLLDSISGWWEGNKGPDWHFHVNETQDVR